MIGLVAVKKRMLPGRAFLLTSAAILLAVECAAGQEPDTRAARLQKQRQEKAAQLRAAKRNGLETVLYDLKDRRWLERFQAGYKGFHPLFGGLATGSGMAFGALYQKDGIADGALDFQASAQVSLNGYQKYQLQLKAPDIGKSPLSLYFKATQSNSPQEDFYGVGSGSNEDNRTNYRLETLDVSGSAGLRLVSNLEVGVRGGILNTNVGRGTDSRFPSVDDVFTPLNAPGLGRQPHYTYTGGFVRYDSRDNPLNPRSGGLYQVEGRHYSDRTIEEYSFDYWRIEAHHYFPFFNERRVIAVRAKADLADPQRDRGVPFFLMPTIGGSDDLRGYREFRFRDRNTLIFNLEYRWEAFSGLDLAIFGDAGNVYPTFDDITLHKLKTSYGFGLRFNTARSVFLRFDFGFSPDGTRKFVKFNHVF